MNHTFVLLFVSFIAVIKMIMNLQTTASRQQTSKVPFSWMRPCQGPQQPSNLFLVKSVLQNPAREKPVAADLQDRHRDEDKENYELWKLLLCFVLFLLISLLF